MSTSGWDWAYVRRVCSGKQRYAKNRARYVADVQRKLTGEDLSPYKCPVCRRWHIGHTPKRVILREIERGIA